MKPVEPEDMYSDFHFISMKIGKGIYTRRIHNFEKAKEKPEWQYFVKGANFCNSNGISSKEYLTCLCTYFGGWFKPEILGSVKSVNIYKDVKDQVVNGVDDEEMIYTEISKSLSFVVNYMINNNYERIVDYFNENKDLFPTVLEDLENKNISIYFLVCFDYIKSIIDDYPQDMISDFFPNYGKQLLNARAKIMCFEKTKKVANNIEFIVTNLLEKKKKTSYPKNTFIR